MKNGGDHPSSLPRQPANDLHDVATVVAIGHRAGGAPAPGDARLAAAARAMLAARRRFEDQFGAELFADPARDILLDLFAAAGEGRRVTVAHCCATAATSAAAARRHVDALAAKGLVLLDPASASGGRCLTLTERARRDMRDYLNWTITARPA